MPTLREELESLAKAWEVLAQDHKATGADAGLIQAAVDLRTLAARCEPEKPGEAVALPEVLSKARGALEEIARTPNTNCAQGHYDPTGPGCDCAGDKVRAALSAIEAYSPQPLPDAVREVAEELREAAAEAHDWNRPVACPPLERRTTDWAERLADLLESAVPEKREALPEGIGAVVEEMRAAVGPSAPAADYPLSAGQVRAWLTRLESAAVPAAPDEPAETAGAAIVEELRRASDELATEGVGIPAGLREALAALSDRSIEGEAVRWLAWALELIDDYEGRLISFGDPPHLVNSTVHVRAKADAHRALAALSAHADSGEGAERPRIVCLCGSTRFFATFQEASLRETVAGKIVLSIGCNLRSDHQLWADPAEREGIKRQLDELHLRKIDLADEVLVLDVGGYVGDSTRREIAYAESVHRPIRYLSQEAPELAAPPAPAPSAAPTGADFLRKAPAITDPALVAALEEVEEGYRPGFAPSAAGDGEEEEGDRCPNCGERTTFTAQSSDHVERHGLDTPPYEPVHQEWLECDRCGAPTDDEEIARANAPACPEVADLKEAIIGAAREAAREELAAWSRAGEDQPSLFTLEDWRRFYVGTALSGLDLYSGPPADQAARAIGIADACLAALAPKPDPAPKEHVAPNTASFEGVRP